MPVKFESQLNELLEAGIIDSGTLQRITEFYQQKQPGNNNRMLLVFGIIGSILVGLGAILIIAHNWDQLSRISKLIIAFVPLLGTQAFCSYVCFSRRETGQLNEVASTLLFFAIGTCIALVSQVYNLESNLPAFLLTWSILFIPVIYLMRSAIGSLLTIVLIGYYGLQEAYFTYDDNTNWHFILLASIIPGYIYLIRFRPFSNVTYFHHWLIAISCVSMPGMYAGKFDEWLYPAYMSLFGCFYLLGNFPFFKSQKRRSTAYLFIGSIGIVVILLIGSFHFIWEELHRANSRPEIWQSEELWVSIIITISASWLAFKLHKTNPDHFARPLEFVFLIFFLLCLLALISVNMSALLTNILLLAIGILVIRKGQQTHRLEVLNYGLLILTAQIICRFFESDLSFLVRGLLFITVGAGFFFANYRMLSRRKSTAIVHPSNQQA